MAGRAGIEALLHLMEMAFGEPGVEEDESQALLQNLATVPEDMWRVLPAGAPLVLYGPYRFAGEFTAPSNLAFDRSLRDRDPAWGVRDLRDLDAAAHAQGLALTSIAKMPANNHVVVFRRHP